MKVLVVEDSERLRYSLCEGLRGVGFTVRAAADGDEALREARADAFDVVVLDLMIPRRSGFDVLRELRRLAASPRVLILSAKDQVRDRVKGLDLGADDYLVKPFHFEELCSRINALVRRRYESSRPTIALSPRVALDTASKTVTVDGERQTLRRSEWVVLELLALRRGRVQSQQELLDHLHHADDVVSSNVVEVVVSALRKKLHLTGEPPIIVTRRGLGYVIE